MASFKDLSGQVFNELTITNEYETRIINNKSLIFWKCLCSCGKETWLLTDSIVSNHTKSCGHLCRLTKSLPKGEASFNAIYRGAKASAIARGYAWELSKEQYLLIANNDCYYCGSKPSNKLPSRKFNGDTKLNGLDRIINDKGYFIDNVVACCTRCNFAKGTMNTDQFIDYCRMIVSRFI